LRESLRGPTDRLDQGDGSRDRCADFQPVTGAAEHGDEIARPCTFTRNTQKPLSGLWKVTRSMSPDRGSRSLASLVCPLIPPLSAPGLETDSHHRPG
jgi:hypothetical protein